MSDVFAPLRAALRAVLLALSACVARRAAFLPCAVRFCLCRVACARPVPSRCALCVVVLLTNTRLRRHAEGGTTGRGGRKSADSRDRHAQHSTARMSGGRGGSAHCALHTSRRKIKHTRKKSTRMQKREEGLTTDGERGATKMTGRQARQVQRLASVP